MVFKSLGFIGHHEPKGFLLVGKKLFFPESKFFLWRVRLPPSDILLLEQRGFRINKLAFRPDKVFLNGFSDLEDLPEGLLFAHMVLQVAAEVKLNKFTKVGDVVPRAGDHLTQPQVELVVPIDLDHAV